VRKFRGEDRPAQLFGEGLRDERATLERISRAEGKMKVKGKDVGSGGGGVRRGTTTLYIRGGKKKLGGCRREG